MPRRFTKTGFSSLEVKCLLLFSVFLIGVMTVSFLLYWYVTESVVAQRDPDTARLLADRALLIKHWGKLESKKEFLWIVNQLTDQLSEQQYEWRMVSPDSPEAEKDVYVRKLIARAEEHPETPVEPVGRLVRDKYLYYKPVYAEQTCLDLCHNDLDAVKRLEEDDSQPGRMLQVGDLMTVLCVQIPNGPTQATMTWFWNMLLTVAVLTVFLGIFVFYLTIRYVIIRPLHHLREVSTAIAHGNMEVRAKIHTGDEFESLGRAFNRMLHGLITSQRELRVANKDRDRKIEELGQANMQLKELNRIKSDFLATMSHELRTPLNSILGFSEVLGGIQSLDAKQKRYVHNIQNSGRLLLGMINDVLDLAKMESGQAQVHLTDFSLEYIISAQCDLARPLAEKKNISLSYEVPKNLPMVHLDQNRFQQILTNLLSNAIKFTPEGGVVKVLVTPETDPESGELNPETAFFRMAVSDTGVGMTEEDMKNIFEKFRQGTSATGENMMTREYSGSGLGLSIVKEICHLLHGEISVASTPGVGSTFTVHLPWKVKDSSEREEEIYF
ncbi:MAG: HAMP domain-containing protein [Thermoguttaceae bacterium]|nr:HAMP domain-containing protein [Thermoguttaceae bacterium]MBR0191726.1 HAMP domain-containing protein [Thermoguttaceae bacterium]